MTNRLVPLEQLQFQTASEHLTKNVPVARPSDDAGTTRQALLGQRYDAVGEIVVCDEAGTLVGLINVEDLLAAKPETPLAALMDDSPPVVTAGVDQEHVAWLAIRRNETSLAVVNAEGHFQGLITPRRIFEVLLFEHDEDTARLGGFLETTSEAYSASDEPLLRRLGHRLPWLFVGLLGAMLSAELVGVFEAKLQSHLVLAFFVPGVVYLADAVETQTETLIIRGMSLGISIERVFWREVVTGFLVGIVLASTVFPIVLWRWERADVASAVSVALLAACSIASGVAMILPWLLRSLRQDPAFAAGPLATVIQDLLSVLVYLLVCLALV
jgi:magnesium transporter